MPLVTYVYRGGRERHYPYPPIARVLKPGDEIDLDPEQVPADIPLEPKGALEAAPDKPTAPAGRRGRTARAPKQEG
jgi:hypothetical protein